MTYEQAVEILRKKGWCCTAAHPYSAFKNYQCGPRWENENYGPFPGGFVESVYGEGDTFIEAVQYALRFERTKEAKDIAALVEADIEFQKHA